MLNDLVTRSVPIDDLLIHAEFVRALACELVRDPQLADDLAQETWVTALRKPPHHGAALRGWLATLMHNLRRNLDRSARRRRAREAAVLPPDPGPSPQQILEREQVRERLVRAVLRLEEPFRTVVLLRYYEDLPTGAIAQRLGVPAATVRTRLARGIARLRDVLDEQHHGARAWVAPLATWAVGPGGTTAAVAAAGIVMKKIALSSAAAALLVLVWLVASHDDPAPSKLPSAAAPIAVPVAQDNTGTATQREAVGAVTTSMPAAGSSPMFPCERGTGTVFGEVLDELDQPVTGVEVVAEPSLGTLPPRFLLRDDRSGSRSARTDAGGRFLFDEVVSGPLRVRAVSGDSLRAEVHTTLAPGGEEGPLLLRARPADPGDWLRVTVVDSGRQPVAGAVVEVHGWSSSEAFAARPTDPWIDPLARGVTGADGVFELRGGAVRAAVVSARSEGRVGRAAFDTWTRDFEDRVDVPVVLAAPGSLAGAFTGPGADSVDGAMVSLHAQPTMSSYFQGGGRRIDVRVTGRTFRCDDLAPGCYSVTLSAASGARLVVPPLGFGEPVPNAVGLCTISIQAGERTNSELAVAIGGRLRGVVRGVEGPVAGARVRAVLAPASPNYPAGFLLRGVHVWRLDRSWEAAPNDPMSHIEGLTDAEGVYELRSLQPGSYRVEVVAGGLAFDRRMGVVVEDGAATSLRHDLVAAGVLQFAAHDLVYVGVTPVGASTPTMLAITDREFVTFPGLVPGRYEIARFHSDADVAPVVLATAAVVAGRTTWVDLREVVDVVSGRVTAGGNPVADASVCQGGNARRTDAFGRFHLECGQRRSPTSRIRVDRLGVRTEFSWPGSADAVLELGRRHVTIDAVDENGVSLAVALDLRALPTAAPATGLVGCHVERRLPAGVRTSIGPVPDWLLHGDVVFEDGVRVPISMFPGTNELKVVRPPTGRVRVQVRNADGSPTVGVSIDALTWTGNGPRPADDDEFREGEGRLFRQATTGEDGVVEFAVAAGEVLVAVSGSSARLSVALGATVSATLTLR